jgi:hypothetical protein
MRGCGCREHLRVLLAPNEDGFGTSAWAVRLAKALLRRAGTDLCRLVVAVSSRRLVAFLENALAGCAGIEIFLLEGVTDRIELVKNRGGVEIAPSLTRSALSYPASADQVRAALEKGGLLRDLDLVVDFGVPQVVGAVRARARSDSGRRPTAAGTGIRAVTVFDHMWSRTLKELARSARLPEPRWKKLSAALLRIRKDESSACEVFLLPDPVSPPWVGRAWKTLLGRPASVLAGFPGGPLWTLEFVGDPAFRALWQTVASGAPCPKEARSKARAHARRLLGIEDETPILYVSGGGSGVWDELLTGLLDAYLKDPPCYSVVVYAPNEARRRKVEMAWHGNVLRSQWGPGQRIVFLDRVRGETHHVLFPGFDLALTRAGGGTVADCLSCGVPMVLVEEPGMWQVEQIRLRCRELGLARTVSLDAFRARPRTCVESRKGRLVNLRAERERILGLASHGEIRLAEALLDSLTYPD